MKDGIAVQSFGYKKYLPLGSPEILVENLSRWGVDEIAVIDISCTKRGSKIDYELVGKLADSSSGTPLIYGGGIRSSKDASLLIQKGADRVIIENSFLEANSSPIEIKDAIGAQAIIMSLPVIKNCNNLFFFDYVKSAQLKLADLIHLIDDLNIAEFLLTDVQNEGAINTSFDSTLIDDNLFENISLICNGGINSVKICEELLEKQNVQAVVMGNKLNHSELSYKFFKNELSLKIKNKIRC